MNRRYLFGPTSAEFADQNLHPMRDAGHCLTFGYRGGTDLQITAEETWQTLCARLPAGWCPDFLVLDLAYRTIPAALWSAPVPVVGLAGDWPWLWHGLRRVLPCCDLVFTDPAGVAVCQRAGFSHVFPANLYGLPRSYLNAPDQNGERDIAILFVGNMQPAVQRECLGWIGRLAALAERHRVVIAARVFGEDYRALLRRGRIVFNRSARGECNQRTLEATACGALLFQERDNAAVAAHFRDREDCVFYSDDDLETLLEYYLTHEDERRTIAESGRQRALQLSYAFFWQQVLDHIEHRWPQLQERAAQRPALQGNAALLARVEQAAGSMDGADVTLVTDLEAAAVEPNLPVLCNALGVAMALAGKARGVASAPAAGEALKHIRQAVAANPMNPVVALNLIETLIGVNNIKEAVNGACLTLALLARIPEWSAKQLDAPRFPPGFDVFRVEWERAAWANAGRPAGEARAKMALLRWRLHSILGELTKDLLHFHEAAMARPDLPTSRASLACALGRAKRPMEAIPHLRFAVETNPFDAAAARALFQALVDSDDEEGQLRLIHQRRLLHRAAPQLVVPEAWFVSEPIAPPSRDPQSCRVVWEGPLRAAHSLGLVNRELCRGLLRRGHELSLLALDPSLPAEDLIQLDQSLIERLERPLSGAVEVHVRLAWPPDPTPPPAGRWVVQQPWEYGSIPRAWLNFMADRVDEIWTPSRFVRDCFVKSGVPAERVQVVPHGIDPMHFRPDAPTLPLKTRKSFKFLFVGGTIPRKGFDILLTAFRQAFSRADDVCLVVKDMGTGTFYRNQTAEALIARCQADAAAPEIEYISTSLAENELPGLYTACDCLVHPYRGEGFGLPILEALACGLPVVVTQYGPALDFCDDLCAYFLPARLVHFPDKRVGDLETVDHPWLAEPDAGVLEHVLRHIRAHPEEARTKGEVGRQRVHAEFTWEHVASIVEQRLMVLRERPLRRPPAPTPANHFPPVRLIQAAPPIGPLSTPAVTPRSDGPMRVSLCMIVKNEEANLPACLRSVADLVDEIILVDTGSTDRTKEIAASFAAKIYDFPWIDHFSAARNESLRHATSEWIFWMDADDRLDEANRGKLRALFAELKQENAAFCMKCLCLPDPDTGNATVVDHVRLFRNDPALRWEHRVHEQILPAIRRRGGEVKWCDVMIHHAGYQDAALRKKKLQRDLRLLESERAELGEHPFTLFNLGSILQELGRHGEALALLRGSLERSHPSDSIVRKLYALIVTCHRAQGQTAEALAACAEGRRLCPDDTELLFAEALLRREQKDLAGAAACMQQLLESQPASHFASVDAGLRGYKARQNLGAIYCEQGKFREAEQEWRAAIAERPDFLPAWLALADLYVTQQRWTDLDEATTHMEEKLQWLMEASVMRGRAEMAQRSFAAARQRLEQTIAVYPKALWPRVILSHVLLQEGRDLNSSLCKRQ